MLLSFFDEFGHVGPFIARNHPRYNTSPVFGLAGYIIPHDKARHFATFFFQLKGNMLAAELKKAKQHPATWEKKGSELISTGNIRKYVHIREGLARFLNELYKCGGKIIYYGREKYQKPEHSNSGGLYTTVLSHVIHAADDYCSPRRTEFMMILDQHQERQQLLASACKTMFSTQSPARWLIEPPFQVESHLYQTIQAADWIAALVGRYVAHQVDPEQYHDWAWADTYFGKQIRNLSTHSKIWKPSAAQRTLPLATS